MERDFLEEYTYSAGLTMPESVEIEVKKVTKEGIKNVDLYYKDIDGGIKKLGPKADSEFLKYMIERIEKKYGTNLNDERTDLIFYIDKDEIPKKSNAYFYALIKTPYGKEYFENVATYVKEIEEMAHQKKYIPYLRRNLLGVVNLLIDMDKITAKTLVKGIK